MIARAACVSGRSKTINLTSRHTQLRHVFILHGYTGTGHLTITVTGPGTTEIDALGDWKHP